MEQAKRGKKEKSKTGSEPSQDKDQDSDQDSNVSDLGGENIAETILFSIVVAAFQSPETFGADDVMSALQNFGLENVIEEARVFSAEMGESSGMVDPDDDYDDEALLADLDI